MCMVKGIVKEIVRAIPRTVSRLFSSLILKIQNYTVKVIRFGILLFSDIDECSAEHKCDVNAVCNNTKGSYNCTCKKGYYGDGRNCTGKFLKSLNICSFAMQI